MSRSKLIVAVVGLLALVAIVWHFAGTRGMASGVTPASEGSAESSARENPSGSKASVDAGRSYPHAVHDPMKREEMRKRLLVALTEAQREAEEEKAHPGSAPAPNARGNREPNDLKEFGKFVSQAIKEDFMPMAKACLKDLDSRGSRGPDAGGNMRVAFKLIGDKQIGGVVDESHIDDEKSSIHDDKFETCLRESMYGVYFDPPPFGGEATLNFDVVINSKGELEEEVPDFQNIKDRRGETSGGPAK